MKVFFNEDASHFWNTRHAAGIDVTEQVLREFIFQYKGTDITDFVLNINAAVSSSESNVMQSISDKYLMKEENGHAVDYTDTWAKPLYELREQGIDPYAVWIETIRSCGMNPWISIRMNDIHYAIECETHLVKATSCEQHPEWWICQGRDAVGYFDKCLNYLLDDVQDYMLRYIKEQLSRYDVHGIELDFSREPFCFPEGYESQGRRVMLKFFSRVKEVVSDIEKERNKKIKIGMLCPANPVTTYRLGFDVGQIAKYGYLDFVAAGPRWASINLDVPIGLWKNLVGDKVEVGGIQEIMVTGYPFSKDVCSDVDMAFGQAAAFASMGADLIYLYNMFDSLIETGFETRNHPLSTRNNSRYILDNIGKTEQMSTWTRRCPLTYDDFVGLPDPLTLRLPMPIGAGGASGARLVIGKIEKGQKAFVNLETKEPVNPENLTVYVNGVKAQYSEELMVNPYIVRQNGYSFQLQLEAEEDVTVVVQSSQACQIEYMEILICGVNE